MSLVWSMGAFGVWFGRSYRLLSVIFVAAIALAATGDELAAVLLGALHWSQEQALGVQILGLFLVPLFVVGLSRVAANLIVEPFRADMERDLAPFLLLAVGLFKNRDAVREENARIEYRWRPEAK